ncbi:hypothetical protein [Salinibacter ruber]|uniref:Uncharacterized protein n=1 Tax=Salinibacter ruber TaxID=146919 RepID=A0AAW5P6X2_9BACT|nr:hypothetical protein [Salinibacter ruber]MCS4157811.1 hypothetical protein [Salinibacter ruber]
MSPVTMKWGLNQLKKNGWFIRLDPSSNETEGEVRKNLFATAFARASTNSIGLDSSGGIFAPEYLQDAAKSRRNIRRKYDVPERDHGPLRHEVVRDALRWVQREVSAPTGNYAVRRGKEVARTQIEDAARAAIYAYPGGKSTLTERALSAAEAERDKIASNL